MTSDVKEVMTKYAIQTEIQRLNLQLQTLRNNDALRNMKQIMSVKARLDELTESLNELE
jgi:hypothetical protein